MTSALETAPMLTLVQASLLEQAEVTIDVRKAPIRFRINAIESLQEPFLWRPVPIMR